MTAIAFRAQPVALVVAEMLEAAIEGGEAIRPTHENEDFASMIDSEEAAREPVEDRAAGDAATAMGRAATTIEGTYGSPTQHITRSS